MSVHQTNVSSGGGMPIRPMMMRSAMHTAAPTPIEVGEIEVSVRVEVVWTMA